MESHAVKPGLHILGNLGLDEEGDPVVESMRKELEACQNLEEPALKLRLKEVLAMHGAGRPCVHYSELYGTRSSALLLWGRPKSEYEITEAPPCRAEWIDRSGLLRMLGSPK